MVRDNDWFFDKFEQDPAKSIVKFWVLMFFLNLVFWLVIIAALVVGLQFVL